ncbi:MAG: acetyl-CoA carboxylase biotin carboxyl carrier protein subunit [Anaerolineaceae bacterium]|nr:MAG: acetyl-CoA carboxylase biotin carboxyl carrier protein subunit [Anaerolineaceae bacterium]
MKHYTITVNGNTYEVSVEENSGVSLATPAPAPRVAPAPAPVPVQKASPAGAPTPAAAPAPAPQAASGAEGNIKVSSPMPGKILSLKASVGQAIKKGEVIVILEAMKMENEIVATDDGTIASINVTAGQSVEAGDLLATIN